MAKLFSFEDQDLAQAGTDVELDSSAEEGAAAQVTQEMTEDHQEIASMDESVQDATVAAGQLEEVQAGVQATVDSGEGLSQVAAEGYRFAVEAIAMSVGYPKKSVYALYSTENFASTSSRMANTRISLEGIGEFLKNLWERIKAAVKAVIEKVKAFYAKHLSGLGRVTKGLEAMKAKVAASKGMVQNTRVKSPGSLKSAFPTSTTLKASDVQAYVKRHSDHSEPYKAKRFDDVIKAINDIKPMFNESYSDYQPGTAEKFAKDVYAKDTSDVTEADPLVSGVWYKKETSDSDIGQWKESVEKVELKSDDAAEASIASKGELKTIVEATIKVIATTKLFDKGVKSFSEKFNALSKEIDGLYNNRETANKNAQTSKATADSSKDASAGNMEDLKKALAVVGKIGSSVPAKSASLAALNVKLGFAVISYTKFNLAQYK